MIIFGPGKTNEEGGYEIVSNRELGLNAFTYTYTSYTSYTFGWGGGGGRHRNSINHER